MPGYWNCCSYSCFSIFFSLDVIWCLFVFFFFFFFFSGGVSVVIAHASCYSFQTSWWIPHSIVNMNVGRAETLIINEEGYSELLVGCEVFALFGAT